MLLGVGIERLDYTKGIPERLRAVDRLLEHHPEYRERLVFVQVAVPSRSHIPAYQRLDDEVDRLVERDQLASGGPTAGSRSSSSRSTTARST